MQTIRKKRKKERNLWMLTQSKFNAELKFYYKQCVWSQKLYFNLNFQPNNHRLRANSVNISNILRSMF